jgi:RNA polymerase sigma-70 factor (ECF subfamily)
LAYTRTLKDGELMLQVAGFDSSALEKLYDRYSTFLFTLINKIVSDKQLAEEILSDVFVIIWKRIDHFDFKNNNVYTWLVTLAKNKAVDSLKRKKGTASLPRYTSEYEIANILPKLSAKIKPLNIDYAKSNRELLSSLLETLTDSQKEILNYSLYSGMDSEEIAEHLNVPESMVRSKFHVALSAILKKARTNLNE